MKPADLKSAMATALAGDVMPLVNLLWPGRCLDKHQRQFMDLALSGQVAEIFCKGCTGSGKSFAAAMLASIWLAIHPSCRVVLASQRFDHVKLVLYALVAKLWKSSPLLMKLATPGKEGIFVDEDRFMLLASPENSEGFSGMHSPASLFIFDEATAIPDSYFDQAGTQAKLSVSLSNPRRPRGFFKLGFDPADPNTTKIIEGPFGPRLCQTIRGCDLVNVIEGRPIIPGQLTRKRYEGLLKHSSARWISIFAHGEFPDEDAELQLIVPSWLGRHHAAWNDRIPVWGFGLDVADSDDGDSTILAAGGPAGCLRLHERRRQDTMSTVGWVLATARESHAADLTDGTWPVVVDADGVGAGVASRLAELGVNVIVFRGSATAADPRTYANARAQCWGELADRLNPEGPFAAEPWALPNDPLLSAELIAPERVYTSDGIKFRITPKTRVGNAFDGETLKEKLGRSPDRGDAVAYLNFASQVAFNIAVFQAAEGGGYDVAFA